MREANRSKTVQTFQNKDLLGFSPWIWSVEQEKDRKQGLRSERFTLGLVTDSNFTIRFDIDSFGYTSGMLLSRVIFLAD